MLHESGQLALLLAVVSVGLGAFTLYYALRNFDRHMNVHSVTEYAKRYEAILDGFPTDIRLAGLRNADAEAAHRDDVRYAFLKYYNLCSEEFYLQEDRYLAKRVWEMWKGEIQQIAASPIGAAAWGLLDEAGHYDTYPKFRAFMRQAATAPSTASSPPR